MAFTEKTYQLNSAGIDAVSEDVRVWLESTNVDHKDTIRIRLTIEELLLRISEHAGGENVTGTLRLGKRLGAPYISFRYDGESFDPRETNADEWSEQILSNLGLAPTWRFRSGFNELTCRLPSGGHKSEIRMVCAFVAKPSKNASSVSNTLSLATPPDTISQSESSSSARHFTIKSSHDSEYEPNRSIFRPPAADSSNS